MSIPTATASDNEEFDDMTIDEWLRFLFAVHFANDFRISGVEAWNVGL
jgi:hypothetical protein